MSLPQPYYQDDSCTLYNADCRDILPHLPKVDLVLTDPPYGTLDGREKVCKRGSSLTGFNAGEWDKTLPLEWIRQAIDRLIDGGWLIAFTDKLSVKDVWGAIELAGGNCKQTFYWIKTNPPPQPRKNFASGIETAVCSTKGSVKKWNGGGWALNYLELPLVTSNRTAHPTEKPTRLMSHLIKITSDPSDLILDPFAGSGTTGVAAKHLGRKSILIELSERYCSIAATRLSQEQLF